MGAVMAYFAVIADSYQGTLLKKGTACRAPAVWGSLCTGKPRPGDVTYFFPFIND